MSVVVVAWPHTHIGVLGPDVVAGRPPVCLAGVPGSPPGLRGTRARGGNAALSHADHLTLRLSTLADLLMKSQHDVASSTEDWASNHAQK